MDTLRGAELFLRGGKKQGQLETGPVSRHTATLGSEEAPAAGRFDWLPDGGGGERGSPTVVHRCARLARELLGEVACLTVNAVCMLALRSRGKADK